MCTAKIWPLFVEQFIFKQTGTSVWGSDAAAGERGTVYVHCNRGRSRSCVVVACFLMALKDLTCKQVILSDKSGLRMSRASRCGILCTIGHGMRADHFGCLLNVHFHLSCSSLPMQI